MNLNPGFSRNFKPDKNMLDKFSIHWVGSGLHKYLVPNSSILTNKTRLIVTLHSQILKLLSQTWEIFNAIYESHAQNYQVWKLCAIFSIVSSEFGLKMTTEKTRQQNCTGCATAAVSVHQPCMWRTVTKQHARMSIPPHFLTKRERVWSSTHKNWGSHILFVRQIFFCQCPYLRMYHAVLNVSKKM